MNEPRIDLKEYAQRREKLLRELKRSVGLIFAGEVHHHDGDEFSAHPHFIYLTGITDEPGAALLLDPAAPVESRRSSLFLRPLNPETEQWDGLRLTISAALRERTGFRSVFRLSHLARFLNDAARRSGSLACLHPLANYEQPISPDLEVFRRVAERVPGVEIVDCSEALAKLRSVKSKSEIAMIQRAIDVTAIGFEAAMKAARPRASEFDVQEAIEHAYRTNGSRGPKFGTIVGSGINSTVLHYRANDRTIEKGDLICIDSGASFGDYGADITRTIPATGTFSKRQREVYEVVLAAMDAAIAAVKPGALISAVDQIARAVITKAGFGDYFIHGIGHHLGLQTHDAAPDISVPLKPGNVITIEPGVYIPQEKLGIRIEDDILVTRDGRRNLSEKIPKSIAAIEKLMARR